MMFHKKNQSSMRNRTLTTLIKNQFTINRRNFHSGKKVLESGLNFPSLFEDQQQAPIYIERFNSKGFSTTGGYTSVGPMLLVHGLPFQWQIEKPAFDDSLPLESLKVFEVVRPKPEIVLFGMGKSMQPLAKPITNYLNSLGIQIEIMDTRNACSTYNVLIEEGRLVAALILPPKIGALLEFKT